MTDFFEYYWSDVSRNEPHHFELHCDNGLTHWRPVRSELSSMYEFNVCSYDTYEMRQDLLKFPRRATALPTCWFCVVMMP